MDPRQKSMYWGSVMRVITKQAIRKYQCLLKVTLSCIVFSHSPHTFPQSHKGAEKDIGRQFGRIGEDVRYPIEMQVCLLIAPIAIGDLQQRLDQCWMRRPKYSLHHVQRSRRFFNGGLIVMATHVNFRK